MKMNDSERSHSRLHSSRKECLFVVPGLCARITTNHDGSQSQHDSWAWTRTPTQRPMAAPVKREGTKRPVTAEENFCKKRRMSAGM